MNVNIDRSGCISCSLCWTDSPAIFEENPDDSLSQIVENFRISDDLARGEIPEDLRKPAQSAADNCPVSVIHIQSNAMDSNDDKPLCTKPFDPENARLGDKDNPCNNGED